MIQFIFEAQIIGNHRDKLAIRGFAAVVLYRVAEVGVECIHVASVPSYLDGVTDGALHSAGGRLVLLGDRRVQYFRYAVDHVAIADGEQDGCAEVLIAFDMRGNADLMNDARDLRFNVLRGIFCRRLLL